MVPWPIAFLTLFYGAVATVSAAAIWRHIAGESSQPIYASLVWLMLSGSLMCGLPLLKRWARTAAVFGSILMTVLILAVAGFFALHGWPLGAVLAALGAGLHVLVIRYLRRPEIRAYFEVRH